jgi:hypothetical protein
VRIFACVRDYLLVGFWFRRCIFLRFCVSIFYLTLSLLLFFSQCALYLNRARCLIKNKKHAHACACAERAVLVSRYIQQQEGAGQEAGAEHAAEEEVVEDRAEAEEDEPLMGSAQVRFELCTFLGLGFLFESR